MSKCDTRNQFITFNNISSQALEAVLTTQKVNLKNTNEIKLHYRTITIPISELKKKYITYKLCLTFSSKML